MIRCLFVVLVCCSVLWSADEDGQLPELFPKPAERTATTWDKPATKLDGTADPTADPMADPKTSRRGTPAEAAPASQAAKKTEGHLPARADDKTPSPARPLADGLDLDRAWFKREVLPPRLGAAMLSSSAPATRPIAASYKLRPGDTVRVLAWGGQPVNQRVPITANGDLAIPGFGMVPVAGLTQSEAQVLVLELVRSHFKQGGAVVALEDPGPQAVTVVGEVVRPGYLVLPPGGTVLEALAAAGGILPNGGLRSVRIAADGKSSEIDLYRVAVDGDAASLQPLAPGCMVFVPLAGPQVAVFGAVRRPARVELKPGENLDEALRLAGGLGADADPANLRLVREGGKGQEMRTLAVDGLKLPAQDGDRLLVSHRRNVATADAAIEVKGAIRSPGLHAWQTGLTLGHALEVAGGLLPDADGEAIIIRRLLAEPKRVDQGGGVTVAVAHDVIVAPEAGTVLSARDIIEVPRRPTPEESRLQVSINGAVARPGSFPLTPSMTVRDLLLMAGRPLPEAQVDQADLINSRISGEGQRVVERVVIDLRPLLSGAERGAVLRPGDALVVRSMADRRVAVTLSGQFRNTGKFTVPAGTTIRQLVQMAGGVQPEAFARGMRFFREQEKATAQEFLRDLATRLETSLQVNERGRADAPGEDEKKEVERTIARQQADLSRVRQAVATGRMGGIDLERILSGDATADQVLQDGDRIELPARPGSIRILGEIMVPGSLIFSEGLSVKEVVARSGGMTRQADEESVFVVRADGSVVATAQGDTLAWDHDRRKWARISLRGLKLMEGDAVIVPADVRYTDTTRRVVRDWTQIMFQVAASVGTIAVLAK